MNKLCNSFLIKAFFVSFYCCIVLIIKDRSNQFMSTTFHNYDLQIHANLLIINIFSNDCFKKPIFLVYYNMINYKINEIYNIRNLS